MTQTLYHYYEQELLAVRQSAGQFARKYPAAAGRLLLEPNRSIDPHVERLIEAFALLTGRVHKKLDDDYPELTGSLLGVLYPHYLAPVPSMAVVQLELEPSNAKPEGLLIERGSKLHTQKVRGVRCQFRTCYPVTLWPLELTAARLQTQPLPEQLDAPPGTVAALRLALECQGDLRLADLSLQTLRCYLSGADEPVSRLYELVFNNAIEVRFRSPSDDAAEPVVLRPEECLGQVGFERDEGMLPYPNQSFLGYRLLTELFAFPEKFRFVDLGGWGRAVRAGFGRKVEVVVFLNRTAEGLEREVDAGFFRTGCTPIVNLFEKTAEPILLSHTKSQYRVVPDVQHPLELEVYSVDGVKSVNPKATRQYRPFYCFRHQGDWNRDPDEQAFWYASRRESPVAGDRGSEVYLQLVDLDFNPHLPAEEVVVVRATCTNRELPIQLQQAGEWIAFELESAIPLRRIRCVRAPTPPRRAPLGRNTHWRLVSHLLPNHLSITDPVEGRATFQQILALYDFSDPGDLLERSTVNRGLIEGIVAMDSRRVVARTGGPPAGGFCRGVEIALQLDPEKYVGTGAFLFACVLERFLGLYATVNSFTQLVLKTAAGEGCLKKWPPRAGEMPLL